MVDATANMKALVAARLMMGDFADWSSFAAEYQMATQIRNRRTARSVSRQIGRDYRELREEVTAFVEKNFVNCNVDNLATVLDSVSIGSGFSMRLEEFEHKFFALAETVKRRVPPYAHVHISTFGLQFEFPEHHFLQDLETSVPELLAVMLSLVKFKQLGFDAKRDRPEVSALVTKDKFLSRSMISAAYSLVEASLSGLFYAAANFGSVGSLLCDDAFRKYASTKESAKLADRLKRVVEFASGGLESSDGYPFDDFLTTGKRYRDAIHHTTPFGRPDVLPGGRLIALYEINADLALRFVTVATQSVLKIAHWTNPNIDESDVATRCDRIIGIINEATATQASGVGGS